MEIFLYDCCLIYDLYVLGTFGQKLSNQELVLITIHNIFAGFGGIKKKLSFGIFFGITSSDIRITLPICMNNDLIFGNLPK